MPGGPHCVLTIGLTLALSRVLHVPLLGLSVASPTLARCLGWFFVPYPLFCRLGLVPRSVAQLCALPPLVPSFRVYLSEAVGFGGFLGSLLCAPLAVGLPPGSPNRLCPLSADCLLGLEPSPSGVASASAGRFSWHPGAAGALAVPSLRLRVSESSSLSAWSFPFRGLSLFLAFVPLWEALSESLTHSFPRSFLVVALSASAVGFADALWLCPERALRRLFASVSLLDPGALSPLLHRVFPDGFRHRCTFRFCGGASPLVLGTLGGGVGGCGGSTYIALHRTWLVSFLPGAFRAPVGVFLFTVRHSARIHGDHLVSSWLDIPPPSACPLRVTPVWGWSLDTCMACDWLAFLSSSTLFQDSVICADFWSRQYGPLTACDRLR